MDDDSVSRALLVHILEKRFETVFAGSDGKDGLELYLKHRPSIIITDIEMPVMDGIAMCRAIKEVAPGLPIIIITAHGESELMLSAIDIGVSDYVLKPLSAERLDAALTKCLSNIELEQELRISKEKTESILDSIGDAFFSLDSHWRFTYFNKKAEEYFQIPGEDILQTDFLVLLSDLTSPHQPFIDAMESQQPRTFENYSGSLEAWHEVRVFPLDGGISVYLKDVTEKKTSERKIEFLAFYDSLTGLPNRALLQDRLSYAIQQCARSGSHGAVLFLDLDRFKNINDSLGHHIGDKVLVEIANRLRACVRDPDMVARLGGDEFIILLQNLDSPENIHSISHRLLLSVAQEISQPDFSLSITASIGISFFPADGTTIDDLLKSADAAMYAGKSKGKNNYQFHRPEMNNQAKRFFMLENALRKSVLQEEFVLHFQPQVNLRSRAITGFEALVRWNHPELGLIPPQEFISLAEDTGLILNLGKWILDSACGQAKQWTTRDGLPLALAVNLSARQFWEGNLMKTIERALSSSGFPPESLELEITESVLMKDMERAIGKMRDLTAMGIRLSIDDFGTGYSSLAALKKFPIQRLKIDKSFVDEVTTNPGAAAIATAILALADSMRLDVVAEGIETDEQLAFLRDKGCSTGQGYLFSPPVASADAEAMLQGC